MKRIFVAFIFFFTVYVGNADSWIRKADFPGAARNHPYFFSIGNKGYVGGGRINDFWEYDPASDIWTEKAAPPFNASYISLPIGFAIGNYGYVCGDSARRFWQYDPTTDMWTQKALIPDTVNILTTYFVIGGKAYVGAGYNGTSFVDNSTFYCYDTLTNLWTRIADIPFSLAWATGFTANNKGYLTGIIKSPITVTNEVLQYDPLANSWTLRANFPDTARTDASAFSIGNIGYFGVGDTGEGGYFKDWWQYNAYTDSWIKKNSIPCIHAKDENAAFAVNNKGYICFGSDDWPNKEVWEYTPDSVTSYIHDTMTFANEITKATQIDIYPNPATTRLYVAAKNKIEKITILNLLGQILFVQDCGTDQVEIDISGFPVGVFLIKTNGIDIRRFVKQ